MSRGILPRIRRFFGKSPKDPWGEKEVLVGTLRTKEQLDAALQYRFYHLPGDFVEDLSAVRYVAIYQSRRLFGNQAGIWWYGKVKSWRALPRYEIREIPKQSDAMYFRLEVERWLPLERPVLPKEQGLICMMTTAFQLFHSREVPELKLENPAQFELYGKLRRLTDRKTVPGGFRWGEFRIRRRRGKILVRRGGERLLEFPVRSFREEPGKTLKVLLESYKK